MPFFELYGRCLLLLVRTRSAHHASHGTSRVRWINMDAITFFNQIKFNEPLLKPGTPE